MTQSKKPSSRPNRTVISLFSGAGGLDIGLDRAGLDLRVCVEIEKEYCETLRKNLPGVVVLDGDIRQIRTEEILAAGKLADGEVFCVAGGPPCQSFSSGGKRSSILDSRGSLFHEYIRVIRETRPAYFVFENVAQIVTAAVRHRAIADRPGQNWNLSAYSKDGGKSQRMEADDTALPLESDEMSGSAISSILGEFDKLNYFLTYGVLNSADYGSAQRRLRFVIIGSRDHTSVSLPCPTHSDVGKDDLPRWRTLRDALEGLHEEHPAHSNYTDAFRRIFEMVPPGGNWRSLPVEVQKTALGNGYESGGGKTGFFRRLSWDHPTPTIVAKPNRKSCAICHPDEIRPLSVRECARVQGFPDTWQFVGSMHTQYTQVGNAVPVALGHAIGRAVTTAETSSTKASIHLKEPKTWLVRKEKMLEEAKRVLRHSARNNVKRAGSAQLQLYCES